VLPATQQRWSFPPLPQPKLVLDLATPGGCKAELTWVVWSCSRLFLNTIMNSGKTGQKYKKNTHQIRTIHFSVNSHRFYFNACLCLVFDCLSRARSIFRCLCALHFCIIINRNWVTKRVGRKLFEFLKLHSLRRCGRAERERSSDDLWATCSSTG